MVRIHTPSGGELVVQGEGAQRGSILCSAARAIRYIQQGCFRYVAYVMDTRERVRRLCMMCQMFENTWMCS